MGLHVKEFYDQGGPPLVLSLDSVPGPGLDDRMSQLTGLALEAHRLGRPVGLQLPDKTPLAPALGPLTAPACCGPWRSTRAADDEPELWVDRLMRADRLSLRITYLVAAVGLIPSALFVSPLFAVLLVVVLIASAYQDSVGRYPLAGWPLNLFALLGIALAVVVPAPSGALGRLLGAAVVLTSAKLLAPKRPRDQLQVLLLGLLLVVGAAILSVSMSFMLLFVAYLVLCTFSLVWMPFAASLGSLPCRAGWSTASARSPPACCWAASR